MKFLTKQLRIFIFVLLAIHFFDFQSLGENSKKTDLVKYKSKVLINSSNSTEKILSPSPLNSKSSLFPSVSIADIVSKVDKSVVNIQAAGGEGSTSFGSGFCVDSKGQIVTNFHVIRDAVKNGGPITVVTPDGRILSANVRGNDEATDIALLEVDSGSNPIPSISLGDSESMRVGDWVIAIGSPFELDHTVTLGIISGRGRTGLDGEYDDFIQTDAAINYGNSGGPLVNLKGEVIGINTLVLIKAQGLGFAIPINMLKEIVPQLRDYGYVKRSSLGVESRDISAIGRKELGLKAQARGVLILKVERGLPGDTAGIRRDDIITAVDQISVTSSSQFNRLIAKIQPGTKIDVQIWRDGREYTVTAKPIEKK